MPPPVPPLSGGDGGSERELEALAMEGEDLVASCLREHADLRARREALARCNTSLSAPCSNGGMPSLGLLQMKMTATDSELSLELEEAAWRRRLFRGWACIKLSQRMRPTLYTSAEQALPAGKHRTERSQGGHGNGGYVRRRSALGSRHVQRRW